MSGILVRLHDAIARILPRIHAAEQSLDVGESLFLILFCHTGRRAFVRSGAVEDNRPVLGDGTDLGS